MAGNTPSLVSRAQLARYAGVSRAAVTNWHKRGPDFPEPADTERELFDLDQVTGWLSSRAVPANARRPHEPAGTTYADRVRASSGDGAAEKPPHPSRSDVAAVDRALLRLLDDLRGVSEPGEAAFLLLILVFLRSAHPDHWDLLRERIHHGTADGPVFTTDFDGILPPFTAEAFRGLGAGTFRRVVRGVDGIDVQRRGQETLLTAFNRALAFLEKDAVSRHTDLSTPEPVVRTLVNLLASDRSFESVYDPFCRTGGFLSEAVQARRGTDPKKDPRVSGAVPNERVFAVASMNMQMHGIEADLGHGPGLPWDDGRADGDADLILANPPFNMSHLPAGNPTRESFRYGEPPKENANFRWLQHVIDRLSPNGRAGVVMANGASSSANAKEAAIRANMVEDGAVECLITLPDRLFQHTAIPVTLWILRAPTGRCGEILFIDAQGLGSMTSRTTRTLREEDTELIRSTYEGWRTGKRHDSAKKAAHISRVATIHEIRDKQYSLRPSMYVSGGKQHTDMAEQKAHITSLIQRLDSLCRQIPLVEARTDQVIREAQRWIP